MPKGDRTGPFGSGPMTGRTAGYCAGYPAAGYANSRPGRDPGMGYGRGRGFGRGGGWGVCYRPRLWKGYPPDAPSSFRRGYPKPDAQNERSCPEDQLKVLQGQLEAVRQRLDELAGRAEKA